LRTFRPAFTLIEILVSVLILSGTIVYVLQVHSQNHEQIVYISERNKHAMEDSLFLTPDVLRYHKSEKSAYDLLQDRMHVEKFESRKILKALKRHIFIPETITIAPEEEMEGPAAVIDEIKLKGTYSSSYFRFKINTF
jgi:prepilin-type N-terminal cleavage/methylation domain-containing protein